MDELDLTDAEKKATYKEISLKTYLMPQNKTFEMKLLLQVA